MGELADFLVQRDENFRRARLPALYSDFRPQRTLNPDGFQANVSAWRQALGRAAWEGRIASRASTSDLLVVDVGEQLLRDLETKQFGRPLALGTVVTEAVGEKALLPLQDFLRAKESIYHKGWTELPWNMVSWAIRQLGLSGSSTTAEDKLPTGRFVVVKNAEAAAKLLAEQVNESDSRFDRTFTLSHFKRTFTDTLIPGQKLSGTDVDILLKFLSRDKGSIIYDGHTVKIKGSGAEDSTITEEDAVVSSLKELIEDLKHQTSLLSSRIDELATAAKDAVVRKNRVVALASLKSKKVAETTLERRFATLNQLEDVAAKIQQAVDQVQLVKVMESSTGVLRGLNQKVGGTERVEDVVDRLREQMSEVDEVGNIIADARADAVVVDEGEIDDELAEMEKQERQKEEEAERVKKEAQEAREVAETQRRLEEMARLQPPVSEPSPAKEAAQDGTETPTTAATEDMKRLSLEEQRQPLAAT